MRIMVTGATGQLGREVVRELTDRGHQVLGVSTADFDLTDAEAVRAAVAAAKPEGVVHCAAYTAVDRAEQEVERCMAINALGTQHLAKAARDAGARLLYVSTDYVFSGEGRLPHQADETPAPLNVYGMSKYRGEQAVRESLAEHFILRVSWVYGAGGNNFVRTMLRLGRERESVRVVCDQVGAPTYAVDLARLMADMIVTDRYGVYHASGGGCCSFAELAAAIMKAAGLPCQVVPVPTSEYPTAARRPLNSRLSLRSLDENGFARLPDWEDGLARFLREIAQA